MEKDILKETYLLKNNTLLNIKGNISNTAYKILLYVLAKKQKELLITYKNIDSDTVDKLPLFLKIDLNKDELKFLNICDVYTYGKGLSKILNEINDSKVNFISYITGNLVFSHLVSEFRVDMNTGNISASISKEVFMYLLDYKLELKPKNTLKEKPLFKKGYSLLYLSNTLSLKSYYSQIFFELFKVALEQENIVKQTDNFKKSFTIEYLRELFTLESKYSKYKDFKKNIIDRVKNELESKGLFNIMFNEIKTKARGGFKVTALEFIVKKGPKYDYLVNLSHNKPIEPNEIIDVKYYPVDDCNLSFSKRKVLELKAKANIRLSESTINDAVSAYNEDIVSRAIFNLINSSKSKHIRAPKQYLIVTLEDIKRDVDARALNKDTKNKSKSIANFTQREYDYKALEEGLLYGEGDYFD